MRYSDEMQLTKHFLSEMRLRISDKDQDILPPEGKYYDGIEPNRLSYVGCLGPLPDPNYSGPQPPNSMGMVLLVSPDPSGKVSCRISGQFDLAHRYIPDLTSMQRDLVFDSGHPRKGQLISMAYRRYTVSFDNVVLHFNREKCNDWVTAQDAIDQQVQHAQTRWRLDPRIMRRCHVHAGGGAKFNFEWSKEALATQEGLNGTVYAQIISHPDEILSYRANLRGRLRQAPATFCRDANDHYLLELYLENLTTTIDARPFGVEFPYFLDTRFTTTLIEGIPHMVPHRLKPEDYRYRDDDGLPGYGITCAVTSGGNGVFATDSMPTTAQPRVDAPSPANVGMTTAPHYAVLAVDCLPVLNDFLAALENYLGQWAIRITQLEQEGKLAERDIAIADKNAFLAETARIRDGVALLTAHDDLRRCFQWMNRAMGAAIEMQGKSFAGWHLFQLGFILTQIRSIYERHATDDEVQGSMESADVLWFATGGGKTEAYLGIISMAMLYGRLQQRDYGTTAWMRFPLRMLSVQQFQRLSYVLAQTNRLRQEQGIGGWPFTIGYFTGDGTPSRISSNSGETAHKSFLPSLSAEQEKAYQFISDCPYCGLRGSVDMAKDLLRARLKHVCRNSDCWSNTVADPGSHGEGIKGEIGIFVSDEECYRYLPTVLVGTVDKLAVIAFNRRFASFFGGAKYFCPEHGFSQTSKCEHSRILQKGNEPEAKECGNNTRTSMIKVITVRPFVDPGFPLLVQDELHLLSESLGNFDAHYETLLRVLQISHGGRSPKVLAATATIKDYEDHIHHLYLKTAVRFPAPGVTQGESFYARKSSGDDGALLIRRWFAGLLPVGRGRINMQAVAAISSRFLDQIDIWRTRLLDRDPILLAALGIPASEADHAIQHLDKNLNTNLIYANAKRSISEVQRYLEEINAKTGFTRAFTQLDGGTRLDLILEAIHHVETKPPDDPNRLIIATSVVSHGVDIAELNFMVMAGWPKSTAEYIQASARSGRVHPGIVICVLSSRLLFETGVFMNFGDYHTFLDRMVDSVPINRFAPNIADRTLPGILSAVIHNWARHQTWGDSLGWGVAPLVKLLRSQNGGAITEKIKAVALDALRVPQPMEAKFDPRVITEANRKLREKVDNALYELAHWPGAKHDQTLAEALGEIFGHAPFRSFRDIEQQIIIKPVSSTADQVLTALAR